MRAEQKLTVKVELPKLEMPNDVPLGEIETNTGSAHVREVFLLFGDYDPQARHEFRVDAPTTALEVAGVGLAALGVGWLMGRIGTRAVPPS